MDTYDIPAADQKKISRREGPNDNFDNATDLGIKLLNK
jgi:hypothetical protein